MTALFTLLAVLLSLLLRHLLPFEHVNLGPPLFERNLVHCQLHQVAPMLGFEILDIQRIRKGAWIEPLTLV